jgi:glutamyl-tRNA reductase
MHTEGSLFLIGVSHHTAPLHLREKIALETAALEEVYAGLKAQSELKEFLVLNTCNRLEIYGSFGSTPRPEALVGALCRVKRLQPDDLNAITYQRQDLAAVRHLLEVSVGLDSQVVGEAEILGQVKNTYAFATERGTVGPVLNRLLQKNFQAAKWVRTHTCIGEGNVSIATVAVDLAEKIFGNLHSVRIVVLGAGEIGEKTVRAFRSRGAATIAVTSRSFERAQAMAAELEGRPFPFEDRGRALIDADVVVASTAAPSFIISADQVAAAMRSRRSRPLFLIDLALPRDFEPPASALSNVFLYDLDDLAEIARENLEMRHAEMNRCRKIIHDKAAAIWKQIERRRAHAVSPAIDGFKEQPAV